MKILIDINHPAHVHYFKNFYDIMIKRCHEVSVISRNKEIEHYLLNIYGIPFVDRGKGSKSKTGKFIYFFKAISIIMTLIRKFKPDVVMSFGTPYPAIAAWFYGVPHLSFNDTEHAAMHHKMTDPFSKYIITPEAYQKDHGKKHVKFKGFFELTYLHQNYFHPDNSIKTMLSIDKDCRYVILRFVSWHSIHDVGQTGISMEYKRRLIKKLSETVKVFISSEDKLPEDLKKYQLNIPPEKIHDVLNYASLFIGEGATMASECAMLGTPAIYINSLDAGTLKKQAEMGFVFSYRKQKRIIEKSLSLLEENQKTKYLDFKNDQIDVTAFMVWFIENYPKSARIMKKDPDYQLRFK